MSDSKLIIDGDWKKRDDQPAKPATPPAADANTLAVDSDWKNQAAAEKERLAAAEQKKGPRSQEELPVADFQTLLSTLVSQALLYMGAFPDPQSGRAVVSLEYAGFHIDLVEVLQKKTVNNLTPEEAEDLKQVLAELRSRFVQLTQVVAQAVKEGKLRPGATSGGPGTGPGGFTGQAMQNMKITP